ncbi:helix-turn-helix domain-containing protein [Xenorhabdus bovienii]|uniref:helix-turn-helix domain-containing protein n=1 Tax=Xenorhabdus bovienii TaxID=40576 RepID=UPI003DA32ECB
MDSYSPIKMRMCDRLKMERNKLVLTQNELAKACGVAFRTYCDYESGRTEPKASFFQYLMN